MNEESALRPSVSVVIPCHNAARWLPETLVSVLQQSHRDLEVVVVDDGSTDHPEVVVDSLGDPRVRILSIPAGGTPSRPRNHGVRNSLGQIVFFCDADDVMLPGKIERQVEHLRLLPGVGMCFTDFEVIDVGGQVLEPSFTAPYRELWKLVRQSVAADGGFAREAFVSGLLSGNFIGTSGVAVRRSVLDDVGGFDEDLVSSEDFDLWLRIARRHACSFLNLVGHRYRRHPASLMQENSVRHPLARITVLERQFAFIDSPVDRRVVRRRLAANYSSVGYCHERNGLVKEAREGYREALRLWPFPSAAWGLLKTVMAGGLIARNAAAERRRLGG